MSSLEVKICGITRREDAIFAESLGVDYLGFICVEKSKRFVNVEELGKLTENLKVKKVGVFLNNTIKYICNAVENGNFDIVQLHGNEDALFVNELKKELPNIIIWKAFSLPNSEAEFFKADRILIDNVVAGSGEVCDWTLAKEFAKKRDIMLAGGINIDNVISAIKTVNPVGIDLASGVESAPGIKDKILLEKLIRSIK